MVSWVQTTVGGGQTGHVDRAYMGWVFYWREGRKWGKVRERGERDEEQIVAS